MWIQRASIVRQFQWSETILVHSKPMAPLHVLHLQDALTVVQPHWSVLVEEQSQWLAGVLQVGGSLAGGTVSND